jgi:DNA-binding MarR family transcriptional regulator
MDPSKRTGPIENRSRGRTRNEERGSAAFPNRTRAALREWAQQRPDLNALVQSIRTRLLLIGIYLIRDNDRIAEQFGVSGPEMRVLFALRRAGEPYELRPTDLFKSLLVPSGTMTRQLTQLEKLGLIKRTANPRDRRVCNIRLTTKGRSITDDALTEAVMYSVISKTVESLSVSERKSLNTLLEQILNKLESIKALYPR